MGERYFDGGAPTGRNKRRQGAVGLQKKIFENATRDYVMQRIRRPLIRNKINPSDPAQVRALTRRLGVSADALHAVVSRMGNSVAAVTKEVELQRAARQTTPLPPL
jgi:hypothetical protein